MKAKEDDMPARLESIQVENFRCLKSVEIVTQPVNVFFGPNGIGKSSFLDAVWFVRDCAIRGTEMASSNRHHGIGVLWDGAAPDDRIVITLRSELAEYAVSFGYSSGRIEPFVGECLRSRLRSMTLVDRKIGSDSATFYHETMGQAVTVKLREPEKLAFTNYLLLCEPSQETTELDDVFRSIHLYNSRSVNIHQLRRLASESTQHTFLYDHWQNLWSALRNLHDRQALDTRYGIVMEYMRKAFPDSFKELVFEQIGTDRVSANFVEVGRHQVIQASGVSDGHLQMLGLLVALFGDFPRRFDLLMFDEPETSLHPHAIWVFSEAVKYAVAEFNRQVFISTHSPVLMSQFDVNSCFIFESGLERETRVEPLANRKGIRDLLDNYALGSLYMAEEVASPSPSSSSSSANHNDE
jgi:predicted ATPase